MFKSALLTIALVGSFGLATGAPAQESPQESPLGDPQDHPQEGPQEGTQLFQEATRLMLRALIQELGPAWQELQGLLDDLTAYHPPEIMPNGDIIIRRKNPKGHEADPQIEL